LSSWYGEKVRRDLILVNNKLGMMRKYQFLIFLLSVIPACSKMIPIYIANPTTSNITVNYVTPREYDNRSIILIKVTNCSHLNSVRLLRKNAKKNIRKLSHTGIYLSRMNPKLYP
jgi:hypothetical protein